MEFHKSLPDIWPEMRLDMNLNIDVNNESEVFGWFFEYLTESRVLPGDNIKYKAVQTGNEEYCIQETKQYMENEKYVILEPICIKSTKMKEPVSIQSNHQRLGEGDRGGKAKFDKYDNKVQIKP